VFEIVQEKQESKHTQPMEYGIHRCLPCLLDNSEGTSERGGEQVDFT
jgi:hypothetical protein